MPHKVEHSSSENRQQHRHSALVPNLTDSSKKTVAVLACVLKQLCSRNDQLVLDPDSVTKFHALRPPAISVLDYLERIRKYAACSEQCFILALVYIDRIIQSNHNFTVNSLNVHRLLITSVMLAAKFFDDQYFNNAYYAKIGGVPCSEINSLEVEFLFMINFSLFVTSEAYEQYYSELQNHALNSGCSCQADLGPPPSPNLMCQAASPDNSQPRKDIPTKSTTPRRLITRSQKRPAH